VKREKTTNFLSKATITLTSLLAVLIFIWPLVIGAPQQNQAGLAQGVFIVLMPLLVAMVVVEFSAGGLDSRTLAILGVLIALNAAIRLLGAGVSGIETAFFLVILGGFVFGPSFGFLLGSGSLFLSALLAAGVGPWLPFQMMAAGLVGLGAGLLARIRNANDLLILISYAVISSFGYGALMTLWNWPFLAGLGSQVSYIPGAPALENIIRFTRYDIFTGGLLWDLGRAVTTSVLIAISGKALLATLRRSANRAGFTKA